MYLQHRGKGKCGNHEGGWLPGCLPLNLQPHVSNTIIPSSPQATPPHESHQKCLPQPNPPPPKLTWSTFSNPLTLTKMPPAHGFPMFISQGMLSTRLFMVHKASLVPSPAQPSDVTCIYCYQRFRPNSFLSMACSRTRL